MTCFNLHVDFSHFSHYCYCKVLRGNSRLLEHALFSSVHGLDDVGYLERSGPLSHPLTLPSPNQAAFQDLQVFAACHNILKTSAFWRPSSDLVSLWFGDKHFSFHSSRRALKVMKWKNIFIIFEAFAFQTATGRAYWNRELTKAFTRWNTLSAQIFKS